MPSAGAPAARPQCRLDLGKPLVDERELIEGEGARVDRRQHAQCFKLGVPASRKACEGGILRRPGSLTRRIAGAVNTADAKALACSPLGVDPYHDGGALFKEACAVWLCAVFILLSYQAEAKAAIAGLLHRASRVRA